MPTAVSARLSLGGALTTRCFELRGLGAGLVALQPDRIVLHFHQPADGSSELLLECRFAGHGDESRARRLKELLLRGDIAGRYDCLFAAPPQWLAGQSCSVAAPDDARLPGGQWFALPVSLRSAAVDALRHAQASGIAIGYRVDLRPREADRALAQRLVPALAAVATRRRQPAVEAALDDAVALANRDGWAACESLHVGADELAAGWLQRLIRRRLAADADFLPTDFFELVDAGAAGAAGECASPAAVIQSLRTPEVIDELFETIAPSREGSLVPELPRAPMPAAQAGDYVFVSYAHADRDYGESVIARLRADGVRLWYDAGIEPGMIWDDTLEQRIRDAGAVVVCLSASYEASRYCTRELKFADFLAKPILPIAPTDRSWGEGLQLMFQQLQIVGFDQGRGVRRLGDALRRSAPQVFAAIAA